MQIIQTAIKLPVTVTVGVLLVALFGFVSLLYVPVQLTPTVEKPEIRITTVWPGASPEEVERDIIQEQEDQLKGLENLEEMKSESADGMGEILLKFQIGTDINGALVRVANRLDQVPDYPADVEQPVISTSGQTENAIAWLVLQRASDTAPPLYTLKRFAEDYIKARLERVEGVAQSNVYGGRERQLRVIFDPEKMAAKHVTVSDLGRALDLDNRNISAGDLDEGKRRYIVRTLGEYRTPEDVENVIIRTEGTTNVYVRDIGRAELDYEEQQIVVRTLGEPAIVLNCLRASGANVLTVMNGVHAAIDELNQGILAEQGLRLVQVYDETDYINSSIHLVVKNIFVGGFLAVTVLLLFLRSARATLVVALAIPISIVGTFFLMTVLGLSINVVSLAGLAFAVGMVVDNAVVVLENIYRHSEMGKTRAQAAFDGTREVWGAVLASTLTTMAVFIPVVFIREEAGQLFRDIAVAISSAVGLSLIVSITVIPCASARLLAPPESNARRKARTTGLRNLFGLVPLTRGLAGWLAALIYSINKSIIVRILLVTAFLAVAVAGSLYLAPDTEYLPEGQQNFLFAIVLPPPGYNLQELTAMAERIEAVLRPLWSLGPYARFVGDASTADEGEPKPGGAGPPAGPASASQSTDDAPQPPPIESFFFVARGSMVFMGATSALPERVHELIPVLRGAIFQIPGTIGVVQRTSLFARGMGEGRMINVDLLGPELDRLVGLGQRVFGQVLSLFPGAQARPIPSLDLGNPELRVIPDRKRAADLGSTATDIGLMVSSAIDGAKVSEYQDRGKAIDLRIRAEEGKVLRTQDLGSLMVRTPTRDSVPLSSLADIRLVAGPQQINHVERERAITIEITPPSEIPLERVGREVEEKILAPMREDGSLRLPYRADLSGTADKLTQTRRALQWNFLLAVIITYLLMSALFENFLYPFVIMFSVPMAALGGFIGLRLVNIFITYQALDVIAMLGFIILVGTVVNNAILLVHQSLNHMRDEGMPPREAISESVRTRIRPIFMSTTTSVFGMSPLILFTGPGSELYRGLGSVVVGGLALSTLITLILVPTLFSLTLQAWSFVAAKVFGRSRAA